MIRFYTAGSLPEAHLLLHRLQDAGIEAHVFNQNAQSGVGEIPFTHAWPEIWLADAGDVSRARAVVDAVEHPPAPAPDWTCQLCAEVNPGQFELCWSCGAAPRMPPGSGIALP